MLAGQGFQQAPHPLQFAGKFGLLLAGKPFLFAKGLKAPVTCEEFQRQGMELIEHVVEEFAELVLSRTKFVQRSTREARRL